nr:hypothetical protein [Janibacter melonis]
MVVLRVVRADGTALAELLVAVLALLALVAGVDEAPDTHAVTDRVPGDGGTDRRDGAGDLVAGVIG